jgi:hypothetical protein
MFSLTFVEDWEHQCRGQVSCTVSERGSEVEQLSRFGKAQSHDFLSNVA